MDTTLHWGPCDGDQVTVEDTDREIRVPVVCGICLDELPFALDKALYSEAVYMRDSEGRWIYSGRMRYAADGSAYWHAA